MDEIGDIPAKSLQVHFINQRKYCKSTVKTICRGPKWKDGPESATVPDLQLTISSFKMVKRWSATKGHSFPFWWEVGCFQFYRAVLNQNWGFGNWLRWCRRACRNWLKRPESIGLTDCPFANVKMNGWSIIQLGDQHLVGLVRSDSMELPD